MLVRPWNKKYKSPQWKMLSQKINKDTYFTPFPGVAPEKTEQLIKITNHYLCEELKEVDVLKKARQRLVLRISAGDSSVIFKLFPLKKITSRLRHKKFASREFSNYLKANELNIPTPACYGLIEQQRFGLVSCSGLILEDVSNASDALALSQSMPYELAAEKCHPALSLLYKKGVNHLDAREENVLLTQDGWFIIDWQYAIFMNPKKEWLLEHLAAFFIKKAPPAVQANLTGDWLMKLHECSEHHQSFEIFHSRVLQLLSKHQGMCSRSQLRPS